MRSAVMVAVLASAPAFAWGPVSMNDAGCLVWDYDEVMDAGLTALPDGGFVGPGGACIELVEITGDYLRKHVHPPFDGPTTPTPVGWTPHGIPSQDGGIRPLNPFEPDAGLPNPLGVCADGMGWDFESGTWEGWTPFGHMAVASRVTPVYGNNVHIERLKPPGYITTANDAGMNATIGGDYWQYSRDVNQHGDYWVGSKDRRKDWTEWPGQTFPESSTGGLYSPTFVIGTNYLDFWLAGGNHVSQRVELQIRPQGVWTQAQLLATFDGIGVTEFPEGAASLSKLDGTWVVVRASSPIRQPNGENDYLNRRVAWNVSQFKNLSARLRFVDEPRAATAANPTPFAHLNADQFRCTNSLDPRNAWLKKPNGTTSKIGQTVVEQPLWGTTDLHAHAAANMSFGGHFIWGDVSDPLSTVYNCDAQLQPITLANGQVLRKAVTDPDLKTDCYVNFGIVLLANVAATSACVAMSAGLAAIPFVGPILAAEEIAVCTTAVMAATFGMLTSPVLSNYSLHGGESPISGGLDLGDWLEALAKLITGDEIHIQGVIESLDYDLPDGTHSGRFGRLHQQYQYQMVMRAWQGGLRLVVLDAVNGRAMSALIDQKAPNDAYDDWQAIRDTVITARRLTACAGDPVFKPGPLCNIADVARTPMHARRIIAGGRVAIVLGTEVDELGKPRTSKMMTLWGRSGQTDSLQKQIDDLYAWGIRKITPVHGIDNPIGGTGIFNDVYPTSQQYHNLTRGPFPGIWEDWKPGIDYALPATFVDPLAGLVLGTFTPGAKLTTLGPLPLNQGLPVVDLTFPTETTVGGYGMINYRYGMGGSRSLTRFAGNYEINGVPKPNTGWVPMTMWPTDTSPGADHRTTLQSLFKVHDLGWILGQNPLGFGNSSRCTLADAHLPMEFDADKLKPAAINYSQASGGHFNSLGLTADGTTFVRALMQKGMAFDFDHLSQKARVDAFAATRAFALEAGSPSLDYATFGVHTSIRGQSVAVPVPLELRDAQGTTSETDRTAAELLRVRAHGGVVSPSVTAGVTPNVNFGSINNNCDFSSKAWAQKYLGFVKLLKGRGIGISTDMNGLTTPMASRYGFGACHTDATWEDEIQGDPDALQNWPRDFTTAANSGGLSCQKNTRKDGPNWNQNCPSTKMVMEQHGEASAVVYDDYGSRTVFDGSLPTGIKRVVARRFNERRDDGGPRPAKDEFVTIGGSNQFWPLKKFKSSSSSLNTGWDYNLDGLKHIGLYPDFFQDVRNGGLTFEQLTPLFNSAEEYVRMWEQNCAMATQWTAAQGGTPPACTGTGGGWPNL